MTTNVITAATVGSIICGLLLVAALSCTCKLYQLRVVDRHPPTHISPLREIEDELMRREAPPSYTATISSPHFDQAQRAFIEGIQAAVIARQETSTTTANRERPNRRHNNFMNLLSREGAQETAGLPTASDPSVVPNAEGEETNPDNVDGTTNEAYINELAPLPSSQVDDRGNADGESTTESMQNTNTENSVEIPMPVINSSTTPSVEVNPTVATPTDAERGPPSDSNSCCTSDTDSDTNQEAFEIEQREQNIIRAAANIRRMRLAGGLQNVIEGARRNSRSSPSSGDEQNENTNNSSQKETASDDDEPIDLETSPSSQQDLSAQATNQKEQKVAKSESTNQNTETNLEAESLLEGNSNSCEEDDVPIILADQSEDANNMNESQA